MGRSTASTVKVRRQAVGGEKVAGVGRRQRSHAALRLQKDRRRQSAGQALRQEDRWPQETIVRGGRDRRL